MSESGILVGALLLVVPIIAILLIRPVFALYLEALILPFQAVFIIQFGANIKISELLGVVVIAGWATRLLLARQVSIRINRSIGLPALMFVIIVLASLINTFTNWDALSRSTLSSIWGISTGRQSPLSRSFITAAWAVYSMLNMFATATFIRDQRTLLRVVNCMLAASGLAAVYAFYKLLFLNLPLPQLWFPGDITTGIPRAWIIPRSDGTFLEPATMANYFIVMIPIALSAWLARRKLIWGLVLVAQLVAIVSSFSPGGWVTFGGAMMLFLPMALHKLGRPIWSTFMNISAVALVLLAAFIVVIATSGVDAQIVTLNALEKVTGADVSNDPRASEINASSGTARTELALTALVMWESNPILGVGIGNYPFLRSSYARPNPQEFRGSDQTNTPSVLYLLVLSETGAVGLIAFLLFGWRLLRGLTRRAAMTEDSTLRWILVGFAGSVIGIAVNGLVLDNPFVNYYWFIAGVGLAAIRLADHSLRESSQ